MIIIIVYNREKGGSVLEGKKEGCDFSGGGGSFVQKKLYLGGPTLFKKWSRALL